MLKDDFAVNATIAYWTAQHKRQKNTERQKADARSARPSPAKSPQSTLFFEILKDSGLWWARLRAIRSMIAATH
jgi:hypothetical protein